MDNPSHRGRWKAVKLERRKRKFAVGRRLVVTSTNVSGSMADAANRSKESIVK